MPITPTSQQQAVIDFNGANAIVAACPGTGKTETLIELVINKTNGGLPASSICVLMFNSDIQKEFSERIQSKGVTDLPAIKTFHSFAKSILTESGYLTENNLQLSYDSGKQQTSMALNSLKSTSFKTKNPKTISLIKEQKSADLLLQFIGLVKARMLPASEVFALSGIASSYSFLIPAYFEFEKLRQNARVLFFDDWIGAAVKLLKADTQYKKTFYKKYSLFLIDEFQDINDCQYELIKLIKYVKASVVAVGDPDQCLYSWRGANPEFMLSFEKEFVPCTRFNLTTTFRFGEQLASAANNLIKNNKKRFNALMQSDPSTPATKVQLIETPKHAADLVDAVIDTFKVGGKPSESAVLVRRWSQAMLFELSFLIRRIPYCLPNQYSLSNSKEINLLVTLLTFVSGSDFYLNHNERSQMLFGLLKQPQTYVQYSVLADIASRLGCLDIKQWRSAIDSICHANPKNKNLENVRERINAIADLMMISKRPAYEVFNKYLDDIKIKSWLIKTSTSTSEYTEHQDRLSCISTVLKGLNLNSLDALDYFRKLIIMSKSSVDQQHGVALTTIFRAKGCEYKNVFLPFWDADVMPIKGVCESSWMEVNEEEERRLAYVALTRATHSAKIFCSKKTGSEPFKNASKFVKELKLAIVINS